MSLKIAPGTPWKDWPIYQKIFGANALGDVTARQIFYRALFNGSDGSHLYEFEWVFCASDDNGAAKKVRDFIERKVLWNDFERTPFSEESRLETLLKYIECFELQRIVASFLTRPREFLLIGTGEYCLVRNKQSLA